MVDSPNFLTSFENNIKKIFEKNSEYMTRKEKYGSFLFKKYSSLFRNVIVIFLFVQNCSIIVINPTYKLYVRRETLAPSLIKKKEHLSFKQVATPLLAQKKRRGAAAT